MFGLESFFLGSDLQYMRRVFGASAEEVAAMLGLRARKTIENWEREGPKADIDQFICLCVHMEYNPEKLLDFLIHRKSKDDKPDLSSMRMPTSSTFKQQVLARTIASRGK